MERAKLIKTLKGQCAHENKYLLQCSVCEKKKWVGYKLYRETYPAKSKTRVKNSGNCVACVNTKPNRGSFVKGQTPWNKDRWQKIGSYSVIHKWIVHRFGKASCCENKSCSGESVTYHWAKLRDFQYERKRENFVQLCVKCHQNYDRGNIDITT